MKLGLLICAAFLLVGCSAEGSEDSSLACDHFRNIASDVSQGLMTDSELREKLKEVHGNASIATPRVQEAATAMLAASTAGDAGALGDAVSEMGAACEATGN